MGTAKQISGAVEVVAAYQFEGNFWLEVPVRDYDDVKALSPGLSYNGLVYGQTGWNSDRGIAYYSTRKAFALMI